MITNAEGHMIYGNIDSPKKAIKESNSGGKTKIYDYFGSKSKKESELCWLHYDAKSDRAFHFLCTTPLVG